MFTRNLHDIVIVFFVLLLCSTFVASIPKTFGHDKRRTPVLRAPGEGRVDPTLKPLYPETKEFIEKMKNLQSNKDVEDLQDEDDHFELVDFGTPVGPNSGPPKPPAKPPSSCKADLAQPTSGSPASPPVSEMPESLGLEMVDDGATGGKESGASLTDDTDIDKNDTAPPSSELPSSEPAAAEEDSPLGAAVEHRILNPKTEQYLPTRKGKKKRERAPPPPTKQQMDETYKYEVLPPPDNSPVSLDFPASPAAQGEEHLSQHVPLPLFCDSCMAVAFQLHLSFTKFHSQVTKRPPSESEIYYIVWETCRHERFREYGMLEVHGTRHISGPGCNKLEAHGGVKHSRGPWPKRLSERCEEMTEDVGELALHSAWLRLRSDPEQFKQFMCFGAPPRNYCQRYGHINEEAQEAARRQHNKPEEPHEEPVDAAKRLAEEAAREAKHEREETLHQAEQLDKVNANHSHGEEL